MKPSHKKHILKVYGSPAVKIGKTSLCFARQTKKDADEIEKMPLKSLLAEVKGLVWLNYIYGQVSMNDMQRIDLIFAELESRKYPADKINKWYEKEKYKFQTENEK